MSRSISCAYNGKEPEKRLCSLCGKEFTKHHQNQSRCDECRKLSQSVIDKLLRSKKNLELKEKPCPICCKIFKGQKKTCSIKCKEKQTKLKYYAHREKITAERKNVHNSKNLKEKDFKSNLNVHNENRNYAGWQKEDTLSMVPKIDVNI